MVSPRFFIIAEAAQKINQNRPNGRLNAGVAELADALDLGSSGTPCRFKSCRPHQTKKQPSRLLFCLVWVRRRNCPRSGAVRPSGARKCRQVRRLSMNIHRRGGCVCSQTNFRILSPFRGRAETKSCRPLPPSAAPVDEHTPLLRNMVEKYF